MGTDDDGRFSGQVECSGESWIDLKGLNVGGEGVNGVTR